MPMLLMDMTHPATIGQLFARRVNTPLALLISRTGSDPILFLLFASRFANMHELYACPNNPFMQVRCQHC